MHKSLGFYLYLVGINIPIHFNIIFMMLLSNVCA